MGALSSDLVRTEANSRAGIYLHLYHSWLPLNEVVKGSSYRGRDLGSIQDPAMYALV